MLIIQQLGPNFVLVFNFQRLWQGLRDVHVNTDPGVGQKYSVFGDLRDLNKVTNIIPIDSKMSISQKSSGK